MQQILVKMADQRRGKRKSPCVEFMEVNELDLSPENSTSDTIEPDAKILKTGNNGSSISTLTVSDVIPNLQLEPLKCPEQETCIQRPVDKPNTIDDNPSQKCNDESDILIKFRTPEIAKLYKQKLRRFLESFVEFEFERSDDELTLSVNRDELLKDDEWHVVDATPYSRDVQGAVTKEKDEVKVSSPSKKRKKKSKAKKELFVVDTNPSIKTRETELQYSSKFVIEDKTDVLQKETNALKATKIAQRSACFNCGESHPLRDCPLPKDFAKIRMARQKFAEKMSYKVSRYHLEEDQVYGHLIPGKVSEGLRKALGLKGFELPPYIYKMRMLGYPPGWLEEAKFLHSNLSMFDIDGNNVRQFSKKKRGLDPEKIVDYPGFNVPLEKGSKDDYKNFGVQPYSNQFSKDIMLEYFEKEYAKEQDNFETCDMDVDDNDEVDDAINISSTSNKIEDDSEQKDSKYNIQPTKAREKVPSPTLIDLEEKKLTLLAQLDDSTSSKPATPCTEDSGTVEEKVTDVIIIESDITSDEQSQSTSEIESLNLTKADLTNTPVCLNSSLNIVKETSFGTPIIKGSSPYARLPKADNFMKDVSPVINFENLPNSTGKYEQMSGVIQKVRSTLKDIQKSKT